MKPSHLRTPRSMSECYFEVGQSVLEPAAWQNNWDSETYQPVHRSLNWPLIVSIAVGISVIVAMLVQPLL